MRTEKAEADVGIRDDPGKLLDLIAWAHDKLNRLHERTEDEYTRQNLRAIGNALDPETNPRLGGVVHRRGETGKYEVDGSDRELVSLYEEAATSERACDHARRLYCLVVQHAADDEDLLFFAHGAFVKGRYEAMNSMLVLVDALGIEVETRTQPNLVVDEDGELEVIHERSYALPSVDDFELVEPTDDLPGEEGDEPS